MCANFAHSTQRHRQNAQGRPQPCQGQGSSQDSAPHLGRDPEGQRSREVLSLRGTGKDHRGQAPSQWGSLPRKPALKAVGLHTQPPSFGTYSPLPPHGPGCPQPEPQSSRTSPDTCRVPKAPPSSRSSSCGFSMDVKQLSDLSTETRHRRLYLCSSKTWFCSPFHRSSPFYGWPTLVGHSQPSVGPGPAEPEARPPAQREPTRGQGFSVYLWKISHL